MAHPQKFAHATVAALFLLGCGLREPSTPPLVVDHDNVQVQVLTKIEPEEQNKLDQATALLASTLKSREFHDAVLGFHFLNPCTSNVRGEPDCKDLDHANRCEGQCILDRLGKVEFDWAIRKSPPFLAGEIGSTQPPLPLRSRCVRRYIQTYEDNVKSFSASGLAGHLLHEYMHVLGFGHAFDESDETSTRSASVPYAIGYMACSLAAHKPWNIEAVPAECSGK